MSRGSQHHSGNTDVFNRQVWRSLRLAMPALILLAGGCPELFNQPPVARPGADRQAAVGETIDFDGSASSDPDGRIVTYAWNFGDGQSAEGPMVTHAYTSTGAFSVSLTVTDNRGASASASLTVQVFEAENVELLITVDPPGTGTVALDPPGGSYPPGTEVTLLATPEEGFVFVEYSGGLSSAAATQVIIVEETLTVTARFAEAVSLTVDAAPAGAGTVTLDPPGGIYAVGTSVTLTAQPAEGFAFSSFRDELGQVVGTSAALAVELTTDRALSARFRPAESGLLALDVFITPNGAGSVTLDPPGGFYEPDTLVRLTAVPESGFTFLRYSGDITGNNPEASIIIREDRNVVAEFTTGTVTISTTVDPPSAGTVTLSPSGGVYDLATSVTLQAQAAAGFVFDTWLDELGQVLSTVNPLQLSAVEDRTITARFVAARTLTVNISPTASGSVSLDPPGGVYPVGTVVTLTAAAAPGYSFQGYTGDAVGSAPVVQVTMNADRMVQAAFVWVPAIGNPGNILVGGFAAGNVTEFDRFDGTRLGILVSSGGAGGLSLPGGLKFGADGDLYVVSIIGNRVLRFDGQTGASQGTFATGVGSVGLFALTFGPGGHLFASDNNAEAVQEFDGDTGALRQTFVTGGSGGLITPLGLTFGPGGNLFVVSNDTDEVLEYNGTSGDFVRVYADLGAVGLTNPVDLVFDAQGHLFVTVADQDVVARITAGDRQLSVLVASGSGGLDLPAGILIHPDTGNLLVVSQETHQLLSYDRTTGAFLGAFATGTGDESLFFATHRP